MRYPIALIASLALFPVLAQGAEVTCEGESGLLLSVGSKGVNHPWRPLDSPDSLSSARAC